LLPDNHNNIRAKEAISKLFRKYLSNVPGKHNVKGLQKITILKNIHKNIGNANIRIQGVYRGKEYHMFLRF
jgi:hypothetical protein